MARHHHSPNQCLQRHVPLRRHSDTTEHRQHPETPGFVDDTDLWDILFGTPPLPHALAIQRMQQRAQSWEKLLFISGGKLNLQKCYWYYISWQWQDGLPTLSTIDDTPGDITLLSGNSPTPDTIQRLEVTDSLKTLI